MSKENRGINPTSQEKSLLAINAGIYETVVYDVAKKLDNGKSSSVLSILRTDSLVGFANAWRQADIDPQSFSPEDTYKASFFNSYREKAEEGDPAAIETLPKFATSRNQLSAAMELVLAYPDELAEWHADKPYLQYAGTFNPQHIGHRIAIQSAIETADARSSALVQVMGNHPFKTDLVDSYEQRFTDSEEKLYRSSLSENTKVTQIDVPGGAGLAMRGLEQMKLLADTCGDPCLRWLVGSDKFMADAVAIRSGLPQAKAVKRFSEPRMHTYVIHRQSEDPVMLQNDIDYIHDVFGTAITLVQELPYDCAPASSTGVKQLRAEGRHEEADHMELYEIKYD
jgi:hypothetical protein